MPIHWIRWSENENAQLRRGQIPKGRTEIACKNHAQRLGIPWNPDRFWKPWEYKLLSRHIVPYGRTICAAKQRYHLYETPERMRFVRWRFQTYAEYKDMDLDER